MSVFTIPSAVRSTLWSYNIDDLDPKKDKKIIIFQVLNYGGLDSYAWLFKHYHFEDIARTVESIPVSEWNKKSFALWKLAFPNI